MQRSSLSWRDGDSAVWSACYSFRGPNFSSQHPCWTVHNCLWLQQQRARHPLLPLKTPIPISHPPTPYTSTPTSIPHPLTTHHPPTPFLYPSTPPSPFPIHPTPPLTPTLLPPFSHTHFHSPHTNHTHHTHTYTLPTSTPYTPANKNKSKKKLTALVYKYKWFFHIIVLVDTWRRNCNPCARPVEGLELVRARLAVCQNVPAYLCLLHNLSWNYESG